MLTDLRAEGSLRTDTQNEKKRNAAHPSTTATTVPHPGSHLSPSLSPLTHVLAAGRVTERMRNPYPHIGIISLSFVTGFNIPRASSGPSGASRRAQQVTTAGPVEQQKVITIIQAGLAPAPATQEIRVDLTVIGK